MGKHGTKDQKVSRVTWEHLIIQIIGDLGSDSTLLSECVKAANSGSVKAIEGLEKRRQACHSRLAEVGKGVKRIVAYIASHDHVPPELEQELATLNQEKQEIET